MSLALRMPANPGLSHHQELVIRFQVVLVTAHEQLPGHESVHMGAFKSISTGQLLIKTFPQKMI